MRQYLLLFIALIPSLGFAETFKLRPQSDIRNPMGIWAIPSTSIQPWSKTSVTVFQKNSQLNIYLTYNYSISDVMTPFTDDEYAADVSEQHRIQVKRRNNTIAHIDDSRKWRVVNGIAISTSCGIYEPDGLTLRAYCPPNNQSAPFQLLDLKGTSLATFTRNNSDWELSVDQVGFNNLNKTVALMLASLRIWR